MHNFKSVNKTSVAKYLGIYVNDDLKWNDHIKHLCKKVSQIYACFAIFVIMFARIPYSCYTIYSFVRSHLLHGILTWGSTNNNVVLHPLQVLQNKIVQIIFNIEVYKIYAPTSTQRVTKLVYFLFYPNSVNLRIQH